jgi:hypothetical protein
MNILNTTAEMRHLDAAHDLHPFADTAGHDCAANRIQTGRGKGVRKQLGASLESTIAAIKLSESDKLAAYVSEAKWQLYGAAL